MGRAGELVKNSSILFIGQISTKIISFLLLPLYTAYLSEAQYGIVDLISTLIVMFGPIVSLEMQQGLFRFMIPVRNDISEIRKMVSTAFIAEIGLITGYILLFILCSFWIDNEYKWFLLSNVIVAILGQFSNQALRGLGLNKDYAVTTFIASAGIIILNIIFIAGLGWGAYGMLSAAFLGQTCSICYAVLKAKLYSKFRIRSFDKHFLRKLLNYSLPLIPNELSWWGIRASDRLIVSTFLGLTATGIISVGHRFPEILMNIYSVFGLAWTENIVLHYHDADGKKYFCHMTDVSAKFFSSFSLLILASIPFIFHLMVNSRFDASYPLIPLYFIGSIINILIGLISVVYIANHETRTIGKTSVAAAIISIITCIVLVKFIGIYASPISFIVGFGSMFIYRSIDMKRFASIKWDHSYFIKFAIIYVIVGAAYFLCNVIYNIIGFIIAMVFIWISNRDNIHIITSKILTRIKK